MEDQSATEFRIDTLRRRQNWLLKKTNDDSANSKRFNLMEIEALKVAITSMENEARYEKVSNALVSLVTILETGNQEELVRIVDEVKDVIDQYHL